MRFEIGKTIMVKMEQIILIEAKKKTKKKSKTKKNKESSKKN